LQRNKFQFLRSRLEASGTHLQVLVGPRQVGKTTLALQIAEDLGPTTIYESADEAGTGQEAWIETAWAHARRIAGTRGHAILILDEIQKVERWSEAIKREFDRDRRGEVDIRVMVLGSAALLIDEGLTESLAGRFERTWMGHWSWSEMREAFDISLEQFIRIGGYPGAAPLRDDPLRWRAYMRDSIIEPAISRDVLQMVRVDKPALLRATFELACEYSSRELSYQKMLGQMQDAGNTTTLAHYLELLHRAGLARSLQKFAAAKVRRRGSSPKLLALDTGLVTALRNWTNIDASSNAEPWGWLVETAVGAHLSDAQQRVGCELCYWRRGQDEVDFVLHQGDRIVAIEVKSGRPRGRHRGLEAFRLEFPQSRALIVGSDGIGLDEFLNTPGEEWLEI